MLYPYKRERLFLIIKPRISREMSYLVIESFGKHDILSKEDTDFDKNYCLLIGEQYLSPLK